MKTIIFLFFVLLQIHVFSQIKGTIYGYESNKKTELIGAKIQSIRTQNGAVTGSEGTFQFTPGPFFPDTLLISYEQHPRKH